MEVSNGKALAKSSLVAALTSLGIMFAGIIVGLLGWSAQLSHIMAVHDRIEERQKEAIQRSERIERKLDTLQRRGKQP